MRTSKWSRHVAQRDGAKAIGRVLALMALGAVALLLVTGCGSSGDDNGGSTGSGSTTASGGGQKTIGLMVLDLRGAFFAEQANVVRGMVERRGDKLVVMDPAGDPSRQLQMAQDWLNGGKVDAIIGSTVDVNAFQPALDQAAEQAVPVALLGFEPRELRRAQTTVTVDYRDWGVQIGEAAVRCIDERLGGEGEVVVFDSPRRAGPIIPTLIGGIRDTLATDPGARVVATADSEDNQLKSLQAMQTVLQAHPNTDVVVSGSEDAALGAMQAYKVAGKDPKRLCLIGGGGTPAGTEAFKTGDFYSQIDIRLNNLYGEALRATYAQLANPDDPMYSGRIVSSRVVMKYR